MTVDQEQQLGAAMRAAAGGLTPPVSRLVDGGIGRGRRIRLRRRLTAGGAAVVLALGGGVVAVDGLGADPAPDEATTTPACTSSVQRGVLPTWARSGFSDAEPEMPHVLGERGEIVAIVWSDPLRVPRDAQPANKINWVPRADEGAGERLTIRATQPGREPVVKRLPAGPGPSIVDLPHPGCWRLELTWGARTDTLNLTYEEAAG